MTLVESYLAREFESRPALLDARTRQMAEAEREYAHAVQQFARDMLGSVQTFESLYEMIVQDVLSGKAAELHAERESLLSEFRRRVDLLQKACDGVRRAEQATGMTLSEATRLDEEAKTLREKVTRLESRWQTEDDLEVLAADRFPLPAGKLETLKRKYPPPQSWYDQEGVAS